MSKKNIVVEKTEMGIDALDYAHEHNLDISNKYDVKKILEALNPQQTSEEDVKEIMDLLQNADTFMDMSASKISRKSKLHN